MADRHPEGLTIPFQYTATDPVAGTKRCSKCREVKPLSAFTWQKGRGGTGHAAKCRACNAAALRAKRLANPEAMRAREQAWLAANPERVAAYRFRGQLAKACKRAGISIADYEQALKEQGGVCKICSQPQRDPRMKRLVIDHDHATGRFRGLLCSSCNAALGYFGDSIEFMEEAIRYLLRNDPQFKVISGGCTTCGCGEASNRHGNADHITAGDLKRAAKAGGRRSASHAARTAVRTLKRKR